LIKTTELFGEPKGQEDEFMKRNLPDFFIRADWGVTDIKGHNWFYSEAHRKWYYGLEKDGKLSDCKGI
jgi:hypothetical protein